MLSTAFPLRAAFVISKFVHQVGNDLITPNARRSKELESARFAGCQRGPLTVVFEDQEVVHFHTPSLTQRFRDFYLPE